VFEFLGVTSGWPIKALEDFLNINTKSGIDIDDFDTYQMLGVKSRGGGIVIRRSEDGFELTMKGYQVASSGQLMWCKVDTKNGAFGVTLKDHEKALASQNMCLADINTDLCLPLFLQLFFRFPTVYNKLTNASLGTTNRQYLKPQELLSKVRLHLPPIEEQKRIVARIESMMTRIEEARKLRSKGISNAETLLFTSLSHFFDYSLNDKLPIGWNWQPFKALLINDKEGLVTGPFGTLLQKSDFQSEGVPILGIANVGTNRFIPGFYDHVDQWKAESLSSYKLQSEDIVIARSGTVGRSCVIPQNIDPAPIMSTNLIRIRIDQEIFLPRLLCGLFNNSSLMERHKNSECRGSSRVFFTQKILLKLQIPVPPLYEQRRIVAYLDSLQAKVDELKKLQTETEKELEELVPSILDKAFKGEL